MSNITNDITYSVTIYKLEAIDSIEYKGSITIEKMLIGFFDSLGSCDAVVNDYKRLPGFSLPSCEFKVTPYIFSQIQGCNLEHLFYVQASEINISTDEEQVIEIGLFLTMEEAESANSQYIITHKKDTSKGQDNDTFCVYIDEYKLNERLWQDGFSRYSY